ncbi:hypothetical protein H4R34_005536 [Dimargaris verticillata]|uniref:Uncharacterized protein n=1 Tax=Dimargaris verticillata TaxID=2761393 RepID=A0A9W8EAM8_9FUNG|nr:hypothetical protein H4R34_005536 [Dimargaris verticillata]
MVTPWQYDVYIDDESTPVATGYTASGAWKSILEAFTSKGLAGFTNIGGPKMIGLADYRVLKAIEELPGADQCEGYNKMQLID